MDNIWGIDLTDMQLKSKCNKEIQLLLIINNILLVDMHGFSFEKQKDITTTNAFKENFD